MEAIVVLALRLVTGLFLAVVGVFVGYLMAWVVVLSLPSSLDVSRPVAGSVGLAIGSGVGAAAAWWDTEADRRHHALAVACTLAAAALGAWLGHEFGPSRWDRGAIESVRNFAPMALGAAAAGNIAALAFYCGRLLMRRRSA